MGPRAAEIPHRGDLSMCERRNQVVSSRRGSNVHLRKIGLEVLIIPGNWKSAMSLVPVLRL